MISLTGVAVHKSSGCVASFPGPHPALHNPGNEEAGGQVHVLGICICPVSTVFKVVDRIKMVINRKELEMQRCELLWSLSGTQTFFLDYCHRCIQQLFNPVNVLISKFFTGKID